MGIGTIEGNPSATTRTTGTQTQTTKGTTPTDNQQRESTVSIAQAPTSSGTYPDLDLKQPQHSSLFDALGTFEISTIGVGGTLGMVGCTLGMAEIAYNNYTLGRLGKLSLCIGLGTLAIGVTSAIINFCKQTKN